MGWGYAVGAGLDLISGIMTNSANAKQNSKNRRMAREFFRQTMDESYQRTTVDMKKAGLNPILAATNGATHASGNVPSSIAMTNPSNFSSALGKMQEASAGIKESESRTAVNSANAEKQKADATFSKLTLATRIEQEHQKERKIHAEIGELNSRMDKFDSEKLRNSQEYQNLKQREKILQEDLQSAKNKNTLFMNEFASLELDNLLKRMNLDWSTVMNSAKAAKEFSAAVKNLGDTVFQFLPKKAVQRVYEQIESFTRHKGGFTRTIRGFK